MQGLGDCWHFRLIAVSIAPMSEGRAGSVPEVVAQVRYGLKGQRSSQIVLPIARDPIIPQFSLSLSPSGDVEAC